jgi:hypothetical protein
LGLETPCEPLLGLEGTLRIAAGLGSILRTTDRVALSRVRARERSVAVFAREGARTLDAAGGNGVGRVLALLLVLLVLDLWQMGAVNNCTVVTG